MKNENTFSGKVTNISHKMTLGARHHHHTRTLTYKKGEGEGISLHIVDDGDNGLAAEIPDYDWHKRSKVFGYLVALIDGMGANKEHTLHRQYQLKLFDAKAHVNVWRRYGWIHSIQLMPLPKKNKSPYHAQVVKFYLTPDCLSQIAFSEL